MEPRKKNATLTEYRCLVFAKDPSCLLATRQPRGHCLPRVQIPAHTRPAQQVQNAFRARWNLHVFLLDFWAPSNGSTPCAIACTRGWRSRLDFEPVAPESLAITELSAGEQHRLQALIAGRTAHPLVRPDWLEKALGWIEFSTGARCSNISRVAQWNAGCGFTLLRATSDDGRTYWLKATGFPNAHEFGVTRLLAQICPGSLPRILAVRPDWNAWLSSHGGSSLGSSPNACQLLLAAECMAKLQVSSIGHTDALLAAGAFDQRLPLLRNQIDAVIMWLIEAMTRQISTAVPRLSRARLIELGDVLRETCDRLERFAIPDTILHNDLNPGNILLTGRKCVLTDWSEAAIGNPFLGCERLCQLNRAHARSVQEVYKAAWRDWLDSGQSEEALAMARLLAIYAYLCGRSDWLYTVEKPRPEFESYARSLARHMDRAAQELRRREALCS